MANTFKICMLFWIFGCLVLTGTSSKRVKSIDDNLDNMSESSDNSNEKHLDVGLSDESQSNSENEEDNDSSEAKKKEPYEPDSFPTSNKDCTKGYPLFNSKRTKVFGEFHPKKVACAEDIQEFCVDVKPGNNRIRKCLLEKKMRITVACLYRLSYEWNNGRPPKWGAPEKKSRANDVQSDSKESKGRNPAIVCRSDALKLCKSKNPMKEKTLYCLAQNIRRLSKLCLVEIRSHFHDLLQDPDQDNNHQNSESSLFDEFKTCRKEIKLYCTKEAEGTDREALNMCLLEKADKLSKTCSHSLFE